MFSFIPKKQGVGKGRESRASGSKPRVNRGSEVRYHANLLLQLKQEHRQLLATYSELELLLHNEEYRSFASYLKRFREQLAQHLLMEDARLYLYLDRMFDEPGNRDREMIRHFRKEMEGIGGAIMTWLDGCFEQRPSADSRDHLEELLTTIEAALIDRIDREESILFPLYRPSYD